MNQVAT